MQHLLQHRHRDDAISVIALETKLQSEYPNPVQAYLFQGTNDSSMPKLEEDCFLLVLMTEFQEEMF